jgi:hypothetical protein
MDTRKRCKECGKCESMICIISLGETRLVCHECIFKKIVKIWPERSKREDWDDTSCDCYKADNNILSLFDLRDHFPEKEAIFHVITELSSEMRCSEHCGNTVREVQ